jgi:hypothetical protein
MGGSVFEKEIQAQSIYLDTPSLDWDETDVSNYDPDWVLK